MGACLASAMLLCACGEPIGDELPGLPAPMIAGVGGGATTSGAGGSGGSGGDRRQGCGSQLPPDPGATFHATLDSAHALSQLPIGDGSGLVSSGEPDFVASPQRGAMVLEGVDNYVGWPQTSNGQLHLHPAQGTIDFCYRPSFDSLDGIAHTLLFAPTVNGMLHLVKAGAELDNAIAMTAVSYDAGFTQTRFPRQHFVFVAKTWYRLTVSWNYNAGPNERHVRLHVDGVEIRPQLSSPEPGKGAFPVDSSSTVMFFYLGSGPGNAIVPPDDADAAFDELILYGEPIGP